MGGGAALQGRRFKDEDEEEHSSASTRNMPDLFVMARRGDVRMGNMILDWNSMIGDNYATMRPGPASHFQLPISD